MGQLIAFMPVRLQEHWVLVDATCVVEVTGAIQWLPLPQAGRSLPGVCAWRGRALALVDLGHVLGVDNREWTSSPRTLIVRSQAGTLAIPIAEARAVVWIAEERVLPQQATSLPYMSGEVDDGVSASSVLDLPLLLKALGPSESHGTASGN